MDEPWIDLSNLPEDLQADILSREASVYPELTFISKGIKKASAIYQLRTNCLRPISRTELENYKNLYNPAIICQIVECRTDDGDYYLGIFLGNSFINASYSYEKSFLYGSYYGDDEFIEIGYQFVDPKGIVDFYMKVDTDDDSIRLSKTL